jgi:hypothetical protein
VVHLCTGVSLLPSCCGRRGECPDPVLQLWQPRVCAAGDWLAAGPLMTASTTGAWPPYFCVCVVKVARRTHHNGCAITRALALLTGTAVSACAAPCFVLSVYIQLLPPAPCCSDHASVWAVGACRGTQFCEVCHGPESEKRRDPVNVLLVTWVGLL